MSEKLHLPKSAVKRIMKLNDDVKVISGVCDDLSDTFLCCPNVLCTFSYIVGGSGFCCEVY